jgi:hypothetical protein
MKALKIILLFALFSPLALRSQSNFLNSADKLDYLVTVEGDTIYGDFIALSLNLRYQFVEQFGVRKLNGKKEIMKVDKAKALFFDDTTYYPLPGDPENPDGHPGWMNIVMEDGPVKVYKHSYWEKTGTFSKETVSKFYLYDGGTFIMEIEKPYRNREEEVLLQYFDYCGEFRKQWEDERWSAQEFVVKYNELCKP